MEAIDPAGNVGVDGTTDELTVDTVAPLITVRPLVTSSQSPPLRGRVDDPLAEVRVSVAGQSVRATNLGDGTWSLAAGVLTPLGNGVFNVQVAATDVAGNVGRDSTSDELTIDSIGPSVVSTVPLANGIVPAGTVEVDFELNERLDTATLNVDTVRLVDAGSDAVNLAPRVLEYNLLTNHLRAVFEDVPAGDYLATLSGVTDVVGNPLIGNGNPADIYVLPVVVSNSRIVAHRLFYNNSVFDGADPAAGPADDDAIAPAPSDLAVPELGKLPLRVGQDPSFQNVSSYSRGINGLMIDLENLVDSSALTLDDFGFRTASSADADAWSPLTVPPALSVRPGAGEGGSDRVTFIWPDGAIVNTWLEVTVKSTPRTRLLEPAVAYWASIVGETGADANLRVNRQDLLQIADNASTFLDTIEIANPYDIDRNGVIDGTDFAIARDSAGVELVALPLGPEPGPALDTTDVDRLFAEGPAPSDATWVVLLPPVEVSETEVSAEPSDELADELAVDSLFADLDDEQLREQLGGG